MRALDRILRRDCCPTGLRIPTPALDIDFTSPTPDPRITFSRASGGGRFNAQGQYVIEPAGQILAFDKCDHDPATGEKLGLAVWDQRTNLFLHSEAFDTATYWGYSLGSIIPDAVDAPNGLATGDKFVENNQIGQHYIQRILEVTSGATYTLSFFIKAAERKRVNLLLAQSSSPFTNHANIVIDVENGVVLNALSGSGTVKAVGNGWYRCTATGVATSNSSILRVGLMLESTQSNTSHQGDGVSGVYLWGAQLETGTFATSYIPTTTAAATRAADLPLMNGENFSNWYNQSEGTFLVEFSQSSTSLNGVNKDKQIFNAVAGTTEELSARIVASSQVRTIARAGGVLGVAANTLLTIGTNSTKYALSYKADNFAAALNGVLQWTDTSSGVPAPSALRIGHNNGGDTQLNGHIKRLKYWLTPLTLKQIEALGKP